MENNNVEQESMNEVIKEIEKSMKPIYNGELVEGEVISVTDTEVLVNIGYMTDGLIKKEELSYDDVNPKDILKPKDKIKVVVMKVNDGEGNVALSKKKADEVIALDEIEKMFKEGTLFDIKVSDVVKGGVTCYYKGIKAFIPASHISTSFVKDLTPYLNKTLKVKVIEFDKNKNRLVLSRKEVEKQEMEVKKENVWNSLKKGEKRSGTVRKLVKFGAFVDLGGLDGLIHNSDLAWERVNDPSDVVSVGERVEVYVLDFDKEKGRVSLGLKDVNKDPWNDVMEKYKVDEIIEGKVMKLLDFGAIVEIESGVEGLVHITQISEENISKPSEVLNVGDKVRVKILDINKDKKKISLSIKDAIASEIAEEYVKDNEDEGNFLFADLLKNFKLK